VIAQVKGYPMEDVQAEHDRIASQRVVCINGLKAEITKLEAEGVKPFDGKMATTPEEARGMSLSVSRSNLIYWEQRLAEAPAERAKALTDNALALQGKLWRQEGFCGRRDLAEKQAAKVSGDSCYSGVRIIEILPEHVTETGRK
ncbi:MAG TPA: hypothetical protein VLH60_02245, partial [Sedimentisphaerales bacterium]|nr:hypothetical protein [Sedimentisphaerales bacterium]